MEIKNLDLVDRKILAHLDKNAHISYSELGKKIRVAKETVKYRIKSLQKRGVIKGFYTAMNFSRMGYKLYRMYIRLQDTSPTIENEIADFIVKSKEVFLFYMTNGPYNIVLGIWARDIWEYDEFWQRLKKRFGRYFSKSSFSVLTKYAEFSREYLMPGMGEGKTVFTTIEKTNVEKVDDLDFRLLALISNDARASLTSIAEKLGVSIVTVRQRMKRLISKKIIVGFRPILNLRAFGKEYYKVDLWFRKFDRVEEISQHILSHPEVIYSEQTTNSDLEFDIETKNFESFVSIMNSFKDTFPEDIREYSYYSLIKLYKMSYMPELRNIN